MTKRVLLPALFGLVLTPQLVEAQTDTTAADSVRALRLNPIVITATRSEQSNFRVPRATSSLSRMQLRELVPNNVADGFTELPGVDVEGVGPNQRRPSIRGLRGQRILVLADGLRLNNSRRQQDFGEIPALVDVDLVEEVEIVRGPSSVLYGSDAIGGVINIITRRPRLEGVTGNVGARYSTHDTQRRFKGLVSGRFGEFDFVAAGSFRTADSYEAPGGSFGNINLAADTEVQDTGADDGSLSFAIGISPGQGHRIEGQVQYYSADTTGFGFVDPTAYAPDQPNIRIFYPDQSFVRGTLRYTGLNMKLPFADRVDASAYVQDNDRSLNLDVTIVPFPGASIASQTFNTTDLTTVGGRLEATKLITSTANLKYGVDFFRDDSRNSDSSVTTSLGFGPPSTVVSNTALVPNATFRSIGLFAQTEVSPVDGWSIVAGLRGQNVRAATREAPTGATEPSVTDESTLVGSLSTSYGVSDQVTFLGSVGRGFRSPNLVERFFNGPTPEGAGFQAANTELEAETSINVDLGARFLSDAALAEVFVFRNEVSDGIAIEPTGNTVQGLSEFRNVNVEKLRFTGVEVATDVRVLGGLSVNGNLTILDSDNVQDPDNPVGETYGLKVNLGLRYDDPGNRFWGEYRVRHNGERDDVVLVDNPNW